MNWGAIGGLAAIALAGLLFAGPLARASLHALAAVRDPAFRVTPMNPRVRFEHVFAKKIAPWAAVWGAVGMVAIGSAIYGASHGGDPPFGANLAEELEFSVFVLGWWLMMVAACLFWAPRCSRAWTLALMLSVTSLLFLLLLTLELKIVLALILPNDWLYYSVSNPSSGSGEAALYPYYDLLVAVPTALGAWVWSRAQGEGWFGFKE